ncbi:hypothetical protein [Bacillus massiliglaciei]|uniref:hypothetical protein n=1 Tax=Bacillus massiliglaciei TaxID=1816693 RepID=UPI000DA61DD3|nr:hypothetical protein [Bacillus massiliglaciei]
MKIILSLTFLFFLLSPHPILQDHSHYNANVSSADDDHSAPLKADDKKTFWLINPAVEEPFPLLFLLVLAVPIILFSRRSKPAFIYPVFYQSNYVIAALDPSHPK